jgi:serine/threonine protein kinase/WD40 repeat protein
MASVNDPMAPLEEPAFDALLEEFMARARRGERPSPEDYAARHPDLAGPIRDVFPALLVLEGLGPGPDRPAESPPVVLVDFEIVREVGRGGMGVVYEAVQRPLGRRVALKVLSPELTGREPFHTRFLRESQAAAKLHHTNIVPVFASGEQDGTLFFAMQFIDGTSLADAIQALRRRHGLPVGPAPTRAESSPPAGPAVPPSATAATAPAIPPGLPPPGHVREMARLALQAAEALAHAHAQGVLHRDVKPANLLVDQQGTLWVADFGLAKSEGADDLTVTGDVVGTLRYLAPERFAGHCDARSDVYALGATLYEMLTLRPAVDGSGRLSLMERILRGAPPPLRAVAPWVPADLETVVLKALAADPAARYPSAGDLADDLRRFLADLPVQARRPSAWEQLRRWGRRNRMVAALAASVLLLLLVAAVGASVAAVYLGRQRDLAVRAERDRTEQLFHALLAQARAKRRSGQIGQRFDALDALREAARIARDLDLDEKYVEELRTEAIACLALADLKPLHDAPSDCPLGLPVAFDSDLERYAHGDADGVVLIRRTADREELARLPAPRPGIGMVVPGFSPDGRFLAAGYWWRDAARVVVWELGGGGVAHKALEVEGSGEFAFRPDGRRIAVAQPDATVLLCDLGSDVRKKIPGGAGTHGLVFRPDGRQLAYIRGNSYWVDILDADTGAPLLPALDHVDEVNRLAWSGDGRLLAAASDNRNVYVWDAQAHGLQAILEGHQRKVYNLDFHPGSNLLATGGWDQTTRLWDAISGRLLVTADRRLVCFSRDGRRLAFHDDLRLGVWDVADRRGCRVLHHGRVGNRAGWLGYKGPECVDFSPDGRLLAAAAGDGVRLWDVAEGVEAGYLTIGHHESLAFHPDGDRLYTHGRTGLRCWPIRADPRHAPGGREVGPPQLLGFAGRGHFHVAVSADGRSLAVSDFDNEQAAILNAERPAERVAIKDCPRINRLALSPDGRHLAVDLAHSKGPIKVWDARDGRLATVLPSEQGNNVAFSPDGRWLASGGASAYRLTEVDSWAPGAVFPKDRPDLWYGPIAFSRDGRLLAIPRSYQLVQLIEVATRRPLATLTGPDLPAVEWLSFSPDGSRLAAATESHTIHLWDLHAVHEQLRPLGLAWEPAPSPPRAPRGGDRVRLAILQDVYEAENLPVVAYSGGRLFAQDMQPHGRERWSGGHHLFCRTPKDGYVEFAVDLPRAGRYRLDVWLTKSWDYGVVEVSLDGRKVGAAFDGYNNDVLPPDKSEYGIFDLGEGSHRLRFTAVDKNQMSRDYFMGIDCLRLTPMGPPPGPGAKPD